MATKTKIKFFKGDTYEATLSIEGYKPSSNDVVKFAVKEHYDDNTPLLQKTIDPSDMKLYIASNDTKSFPKNSDRDGYWGNYYYDAQISFTDEDNVSHVKTFLYGTLVLQSEVVN